MCCIVLYIFFLNVSPKKTILSHHGHRKALIMHAYDCIMQTVDHDRTFRSGSGHIWIYILPLALDVATALCGAALYSSLVFEHILVAYDGRPTAQGNGRGTIKTMEKWQKSCISRVDILYYEAARRYVWPHTLWD